MKLTTILAGYFKLDGGAMFGVVPKTLWNRLNPGDENNMCQWSMQSLLIEVGDRKILVDTGIGNKQDDKFRSFFHPSGPELKESLASNMVHPEEITDVFLTHMHFDHNGGALERNDKGDIVPSFHNAAYWTNECHLKWAMEPNPRERASFLKENIVPLKELGLYKFIDNQKEDVEWMHGMKVRFVKGHTEDMMVLYIPVNGRHLVFCADLLPSSYHVGMPYVMSYDIRPLVTLEEKKRLFTETVENGDFLYLEHDPEHEIISLKKNDRGRFEIKEYHNVWELNGNS